MAAYTFRYLNADGGILRLAVMQCASDDDALLRACRSMSAPFETLQIFLDDAMIFQGPSTPRYDNLKILRVA